MNTLGLKGKAISLFEIRLISDEVLVLRGNEGEASGVVLKGEVVLAVTDALTTRGLHLVLEATQKFKIQDQKNTSFGPAPTTFREMSTVYKMDFGNLLGSDEKHVLKPGNYSYPFEHILPGDSPESVEGLDSAFLVYQLRASLDRGVFAKDAQAKRHLRVVRTLPPSALEFSQTMAVENIWPEKVEYSITIPTKAVAFGSSIPLELRLSPLLKGLKIGKITVELKELHTFTPKCIHKSEMRHILRCEYEDHPDEPPSGNDLETDGLWIIQQRIQLPRSLAKCLQDCEVGQIKVRHKLKFTVQLLNPDGHVSELRTTLPVMLFISPNLLMDENNEVPEQLLGSVEATADALASHAPPRYDEHQYDTLYSGIEMASFMSPPQSGANTPMVLSRPPSNENLQAITDGSSRSSGSSTPLHLSDAATARLPNQQRGVGSWPNSSTNLVHDDLVARLQNAHLHSGESTGNLSSMASSSVGSAHHSGHQSPSNGEVEGQVTPPSPPIDLETLSKVPSYTTATRVPARNLSFEAAPTYEATASAPGTPSGSPPRSSPLSRSTGDIAGLNTSDGFLMSMRRPHLPASRSTHSLFGEGERRVRLLQARFHHQ